MMTFGAQGRSMGIAELVMTLDHLTVSSMREILCRMTLHPHDLQKKTHTDDAAEHHHHSDAMHSGSRTK